MSMKFIGAESVRVPIQDPDLSHTLLVRQQPRRSRACGTGKHANRRPIDPPPILSLVFYSLATKKPNIAQFRNPHLFVHVSLVTMDSNQPNYFIDGPRHNLVGNIVTSLEGFTDEDGTEKLFAAFGDLSIRIPGIYKLAFSLFEYTGSGILKLGDVLSEDFEVFQAKRFHGMQVSTPLCQLLVSQGMKLRVRKDARIRYRAQRLQQPSRERDLEQTDEGLEDSEEQQRQQTRKRQHQEQSASGGPPMYLGNQPSSTSSYRPSYLLSPEFDRFKAYPPITAAIPAPQNTLKYLSDLPKQQNFYRPLSEMRGEVRGDMRSNDMRGGIRPLNWVEFPHGILPLSPPSPLTADLHAPPIQRHNLSSIRSTQSSSMQPNPEDRNILPPMSDFIRTVDSGDLRGFRTLPHHPL